MRGCSSAPSPSFCCRPHPVRAGAAFCFCLRGGRSEQKDPCSSQSLPEPHLAAEHPPSVRSMMRFGPSLLAYVGLSAARDTGGQTSTHPHSCSLCSSTGSLHWRWVPMLQCFWEWSVQGSALLPGIGSWVAFHTLSEFIWPYWYLWQLLCLNLSFSFGFGVFCLL